MERVEKTDFATPDQFFLPFPDLLSDEYWENYLRYGIRLYRACLIGDREVAREMCTYYPPCLTASITKQGDTALHVAAAAKHSHVVEELVDLMREADKLDDLARQNLVGNTALCLAAASGIVRSAQVMVEANDQLPLIRGRANLTPLHIAALFGHREMALFFLQLPNFPANEHIDITLLISMINADLYDVALHILNLRRNLAFERDVHQETPLHVLARKSAKLYRNELRPQGGLLSILDNQFARRGESNLHPSALLLVRRLWGIVLEDQNEARSISNLMGPSWELLFLAVRSGNFEFLTTLVCSYPDLIWKFDHQRRSIFHVAILCRQEKIFRLIYEIGAIKDLLAGYTDIRGNSMLHLAAMLPSSDILNRTSGSALQMQREILWFKVVKNITETQIAESENSEGKTARDLFTEEHKELREKGEEWMRNTASSCSVVATLIASAVFGASLKLPYDRTTGHGAVLYWVFVTCALLSFIFSTATILTFLSILTSTYAEEDFLRSLPFKLMLGLTLMFISITTMMITFTVSFVFEFGFAWIITYLLVSVPIILYARKLVPLILEVYSSIKGSNSFFQGQDQHFLLTYPLVDELEHRKTRIGREAPNRNVV